MTGPGVTPASYVPQDRLFVWALVNPAQPTLVGPLDPPMSSFQVGETHPKLGSHRSGQAQSGERFRARRKGGISAG